MAASGGSAPPGRLVRVEADTVRLLYCQRVELRDIIRTVRDTATNHHLSRDKHLTQLQGAIVKVEQPGMGLHCMDGYRMRKKASGTETDICVWNGAAKTWIPLDSVSETPFTEAEVADLCRRVQEGRHPPLLEEDFQTATCRLIVLWKLGKEIMPSIDTPMGARPRERLVADPTRWSEAQKVIRQIVEYQPPRQPVPTEAAETARAIWGRWQATTAGTQGARAHFQPAVEAQPAVPYVTQRVLEEDTPVARDGRSGATRGSGPTLSRSASMPQPPPGRRWQPPQPQPPRQCEDAAAWAPAAEELDETAIGYNYARDGSPPPDAMELEQIDPSRLSPVSLQLYQSGLLRPGGPQPSRPPPPPDNCHHSSHGREREPERHRARSPASSRESRRDRPPSSQHRRSPPRGLHLDGSVWSRKKVTTAPSEPGRAADTGSGRREKSPDGRSNGAPPFRRCDSREREPERHRARSPAPSRDSRRDRPPFSEHRRSPPRGLHLDESVWSRKKVTTAPSEPGRAADTGSGRRERSPSGRSNVAPSSRRGDSREWDQSPSRERPRSPPPAARPRVCSQDSGEPQPPQTEGGPQEPQEESETVLSRGASLADGESSPPGSIPVSELPYFPDATPETWQHCSWKATCQLKWLTVDEYANMPVSEACWVEVLCFTPPGAAGDAHWRPTDEIETPMKYPIAGPDSLEECWPVTKQRWAGQVFIVMPPMPFGHDPEKGSHYPVDEVLEESHRKFKEVVDMLSQGAFVYVSFMSVPCLDLRSQEPARCSEMHLLPPCHFAFNNLLSAVPREVSHSLGEKNLLLLGLCLPPENHPAVQEEARAA
eukprot:jgi/Tetstr1/462486/TSEL_007477.t1